MPESYSARTRQTQRDEDDVAADQPMPATPGDGDQQTADAEFRDIVALTMHDLNNVLSVVQLTADLIARDALAATEGADTIRDQVQQAAKLVEGLRKQARELP